MTQPKSDQAKTEAKLARKLRKDAAAAALHSRRSRQMEVAKASIGRLQQALRDVRSLSARREMLSSHVEGFYQEIDKLTKGKALLEVTPLMVDQANDIIRDAKQIVAGDTYLDRIKEFVPAGDNPVYPDVLVVVRGVRQSLERGAGELTRLRSRIVDRLTKGKTIAAALELCFELGEDEALPSKDEITEKLDRAAIDSSLLYEAEDGEEYFDFEALDRLNLDQYLSEVVEEDDVSRIDNQNEEEGDDEEGTEEDGNL